jgi:hypothetical protein
LTTHAACIVVGAEGVVISAEQDAAHWKAAEADILVVRDAAQVDCDCKDADRLIAVVRDAEQIEVD